jgi:hypothetical protein
MLTPLDRMFTNQWPLKPYRTHTSRLTREKDQHRTTEPDGTPSQSTSSKLKAQVGKSRMRVRTTPQRPVKLPIRLRNRQIVDAGDATAHEPMLVEFPVLIAVGPEPVPGIVMPLIGETNRNPIAVKRPQLLTQQAAI